jgi:opacity protein-like surface antigen
MKKCVGCIGVSALFVLSASAQEWPRYETSLNYSFTRFGDDRGVDLDADGGNAQFVFNFNKWFSGVLDGGAVHNSKFTDVTVVNYLGGPRVTLRKSRIAPYIQVLFGGALARQDLTLGFGPTPLPSDAIPPTVVTFHRDENRFAMVAGGGIDIKLSRHVSLKALEVEYFQTRFEKFLVFNDDVQNNLRASAGITFTFGGEEPAPRTQPIQTCPDGTVIPISEACPKRNISVHLSATPQEICQGETSRLNASISPAGNNQLSMDWYVNNQEVSDAPSFVFESKDRQPGTYTVSVKVKGAGFNTASAQTTIIVNPYIPPSVTAKADRQEIFAGEKTTLSATCQGQCGGNMQPPSFAASDGSVNGNEFDSTGVQFDPADSSEQRKVVTITATCADSRSTGSGTTTVTVIKKAAAIRLPDVLFDENSARVNNCGKRILLEQLKAYVDRDSTGTIALAGHNSSDEKSPKLAEQRVANAAAVITAGTGVCLSIPKTQVLVSAPGVEQNGIAFEPGFCSSSVKGDRETAETRRVEVWFIPPGADKPASVTQADTAASLALSSIGCPK